MISHLFIYPRRTGQDLYAGIRQSLSKDKAHGHTLIDVKLEERTYDRIDRIEHTNRRWFRALFYRDVYRELSQAFKTAIQNAGDGTKVVVYLSDEGVWAQFINGISNECGRSVTKVNVQHGYMYPNSLSFLSQGARKLVNGLSRLALGYPSYGMGFGLGGFDFYLTYSAYEASYLRRMSNAKVIVCPGLIKWDFIRQYFSALDRVRPPENAASYLLFALPYVVGGSKVRCSYEGIFRELLPVARHLLNRHDIRLLLRFHPGAPRREVERALAASELSRLVQTDNSASLAEEVARSVAVMGYDSTVLFEATLVGKVPISLVGDCYRAEPTFPHVKVLLDQDFRSMIDRALSEETMQDFASKSVDSVPNWAEMITSELEIL